jgi:hypothetical protein
MWDSIELNRSFSEIFIFMTLLVSIPVEAEDSPPGTKPDSHEPAAMPPPSKDSKTVEVSTSTDGKTENTGEPDVAATHFALGVEFYKQRKFEEASIEFAMAYDLKPSYKIFFNIGQAENMLEHYAEALKAYRAYLEQSGESIPEDRRVLVENELKRLINRVGYIEVNGDYQGASILIDGEAKGVLPLTAPIIVDIGKREVEVVVGSERLFRQVYRVAANQHIVVNLGSKDESGAVKADTTTTTGGTASSSETAQNNEKNDIAKGDTTPPKPGAGSKRKRNRIIGISLLSVGFGSASAAVATGVIATLKKNDITAGCPGYVCDQDTWAAEFDSVQHLSIATDVLIGTAAVSATAGLLLFFIKPKSDRAESVSLIFSPMNGGASASISGRF